MVLVLVVWNESPHDKMTWLVRPAKTQISLGIRQVWSEASLSASKKLGSLAIHKVHSEDPDQTGVMPGLMRVFAGRIDDFVGFLVRWLKWRLCNIKCLGQSVIQRQNRLFFFFF